MFRAVAVPDYREVLDVVHHLRYLPFL
jgi:hypothetical protein